MRYLPAILIALGLALTAVSLILLWRLGDGLDEYSPFPYDLKRLEMDLDALRHNGRGEWVELPGRGEGR